MRPESLLEEFLWPKANTLPSGQQAKPLYKADPLLAGIEQLIATKKAWSPISGSTKRTEPNEKLERWFNAQHAHKQQVDRRLSVSLRAPLALSDFPMVPNRSGRRVISTSKRIVYLIDQAGDFLDVFGDAFGISLKEKATTALNQKLGIVLYVCNSVESGGRGFSGDPFTGQAAAYSRIFAYDLYGQRVLNFVTYYPHQLYSQLFTRNGELPQNKGVRMLRSQATLIVTCGGHLVDPQRWRIIS